MMTRVLLPSVYGEATVTGQGNTNARAYASMNERAKDFAEAWLMLLGDRMFKMICDMRLVQCAQEHATYLASRTPEEIAALANVKGAMHFNHRTLQWSNERVWLARYNLPGWWSAHANNVESCARDGRDPAAAAVSLAWHVGHHDHMFGLGWFEGHTQYGVGCAGDDYVFLAAPPES